MAPGDVVQCFWITYAEPLRWFVKVNDDGEWGRREHTRRWLDDHDWRIASPVMVAADGRRACLKDFGPGAMYDAATHPEQGDRYRHPAKGEPLIGPDGCCLVVALPPDGHCWYVDGTASGGGRWQRTGDPAAVPPTVSVTPSILTPDYHGFLTDGVLREV